jgi:hypothetical protein
MPVHDWTGVEAGVFHDFHHLWITSIWHALNSGVLPSDYYAMADQVAGPGNPDVLTLSRRPTPKQPAPSGATALATAADIARQVRFHGRAKPERRATWRPKRVAVRHKTGDRVVALVEIVSPNDKSSHSAVRSFAEKLATFISDGIHLLVLDVFPPGPRDPHGVHPLVWAPFDDAPFELPADKPLTLGAYAAGPLPSAMRSPTCRRSLLPTTA